MKNKSNFKVGIIGLGYVGLPLYFLCKNKKIDVKGFDIDKSKINNLYSNIPQNSDISPRELKRIKRKKFYSMDQIDLIRDRNFIIFCLPTPLTKSNKPDLSYIENSIKKIKDKCKSETIFVIESTVYPGATREIFSKYKFKNNKKINFGFSSERLSPGQTDKKIFKIQLNAIPKVVSGNNKGSEKKIEEFYNLIFKKVILASSIEVGEMSKLLENSYRSVNIGLVNEIKILCHKARINFHDVISAASTKPFGFNTFLPGPGVGGHCIPIDPIFLNWFGKKIKAKTDFINLARKKNIQVTNFVINNILNLLKKINLRKNKVLVIGVAYKKDINDYRESPSLKIMNTLYKKKISFDYYDPFISQIDFLNKKLYSLKNLKNISSYDVVAIITDHSILPYKEILKKSKIIVDTRGCYKDIKSKRIIFL